MSDFDKSPQIRVSDQERDAAAQALGDHLSTGRLDLEEYHARLDQVHAARTRADLQAPFHDLPAAPPARAGRDLDRPEADIWLRLSAVASAFSLILFFVCGFAFNGWGWAWLFFLLPGALASISRAKG